MTSPKIESPATHPHLPTTQDFWFESQGVRLYAKALGRGRPLVFLHGGLADHRAALVRVGSLADSLQVLAPDLRASGRSHYAGELSWDLLADDLRALLHSLHIERAVIGGTSMGSAVALRFALRYPRHTAGLVLWAPVYPGADRGLSATQIAAMQIMAAAGQRARAEGTSALVPLYQALPPDLRQRALDMLREFDAASVAATTAFLAQNAQPMAEASALAAIAAPTLIVPGSDPEHPPEVATLYAQHLQRPALLDPQSPDLLTQLARFCQDSDWGTGS